MANTQIPHPQLSLNSDGTIFAVRKTALLEKLRIFQEDTSRLNVSEYQVKTRVPSAIFGDFVKYVEGEPVQVTEANFSFLRDLSQEFGFDALSAECDLFEESQASTGQTSMSSLNSALIDRLDGVEERQLLLERSVGIKMNEIQSLVREVARLSSLCKILDDRLSGQIKVFESERQYRRGCEYLFGTNGYGERGEEMSKTLGLSLLKSSADLGHSDAQYRYGKCLLFGKDCRQDLAMAVGYLKQSADSHNSYAECQYGRCLHDGRGDLKDEQQIGTNYIKRSADGGNALGQNHFGSCLEMGHGIEKDLVRAVEYYKLSADQGNSFGQNNFGHCLQMGHGIEKDLVRAVEYYKLSADQGDSLGQNNLGKCLVNGIGISADPARGVALIKQSADQGFHGAQYNYAISLECGTGIGQDLSMAARYYKLALDQGNPDARAGYERCLQGTQSRGSKNLTKFGVIIIIVGFLLCLMFWVWF
jgi:TPR repeat protein